MKRRVDIIKEYLLKEHNLNMTEEQIIEQLCPTAQSYNIQNLKIELDRNQCIICSCEECWKKEVSYKE